MNIKKCNRLFLNLIFISSLFFGCGTINNVSDNYSKKQYERTFEKELSKTIHLNYLLYLPKDNLENEKLPLMVFLHGSGERGDDLEKLKVNGPPMLIEKGENFPFIIVSPQCPLNARWTDKWFPDAVIGLIDEISATYNVDQDRIYLTGLSMGGFGTWEIASQNPDKFAAIVPVCGGGDPENARDLRLLPIWVFHGAKDDVVPPMLSQQMVDALKLYHSDVKFTLYPEANHNSWDETYSNKDLYSWLLSHKRNDRKLITIKRENISASSGYPFYAVDHDQQTRWESKWEDPQWIEIKLDSKAKLKKISLLWENAYSKNYTVSISDDGKRWEEIFEEKNGDGFLDLIEMPEIEIQYVRFNFKERATHWGNSIWEIEVE